MPDQQPWLQNKRWADNRIASDAQAAQWVLWGFALFWNLVSLPLVFQFRELWRKIPDEPAVALAFLFPLVGLGLVAAAVYATRQKRRFPPSYPLQEVG